MAFDPTRTIIRPLEGFAFDHAILTEHPSGGTGLFVEESILQLIAMGSIVSTAPVE